MDDFVVSQELRLKSHDGTPAIHVILKYPVEYVPRRTDMIARISSVFVFSVLLVLFLFPSAVSAKEANRIQIHTDFSEADAVLAILNKRHEAQQVSASDWQTLFATEPYQRLKKREAAMHNDV